MTLTLDPNGTWRRHRFDFCNALEDYMQARSAVQRDKAAAELGKMGVVVEGKGK